MDTRFLESFVVLAERGSVAEAARHLLLTPAALTLRIKALEAEIGFPLVSRVGRIVRPTAAGLRVVERSKLLLKDVRDLETLGEGGPLRGELRLGVATGAVASVLCTLLLDLAGSHPQIELSVTKGSSSLLYGKLCEEEIDAALVFEPRFDMPKNLEWKAIHSEAYIVIASVALPDRDADELLRTHPFIRYDRKLWSGQIADEYLKRVGIRPLERLELDGLEAIAILVDRGLGVSLVPDWSNPWPEGLKLRKLALGPRPPVRTLGMIWPRNSPRVGLVRALLSTATGS